MLLAAIAGAGCRPSARPGAAAPTQEVRGFAMSRSAAGRIDWRLRSRRAFLNERASDAELERPYVEVFKEGRLDSTARADAGRIDLKTQDMVLDGSVVVVAKRDASTLKTSQLLYVASAKEFRTERPVEIIRPEGVMRGTGLTASQDLSSIHVKRQETRLR